MKLSQFKFTLPDELITSYPAKYRDEARLMVVNSKDGSIEHLIFKDIINFFDEQDLLVFNDTQVFPARLYGNKEKTGARIEVFLLRELNRDFKLWDVLVDPARKIRIGNKLYFGDDDSMVAEVIDNTTSRGRTLRFLYEGTHEEFKQTLFSLGETPIPKYMNRGAEEDDPDRYQTIFARHEGAVVAPAAGLHFSRELLKRFDIKGVEKGFLTLHSSIGAYRDIDVEDLTKHKMDSEQLIVRQELVDKIDLTKERKRKVCAVGTTVIRGLESVATVNGRIKTLDNWTNRFLFPPYEFNVADSLVTNFHMPYSTLLMVACAFGGYENIMNAYDEAIKEKYQFGAYGDAMLII